MYAYEVQMYCVVGLCGVLYNCKTKLAVRSCGPFSLDRMEAVWAGDIVPEPFIISPK